MFKRTALCGCIVLTLWDGGPALADNPLAGLTGPQLYSIQVAFDRGRKLSRKCFSDGPGTPGGAVMLDLTFDGTVGKISAASLDTPLTGTATDDCIKSVFVGLPIATFDGPLRTSTYAYRPGD